MSLTSFVTEPANRLYLLSKLPKPRGPAKVPIQAPPLTQNYGTIGTAFDYLARFNIKRNFPQSHDGPWLAESSWNAIAIRGGFSGSVSEYLSRPPRNIEQRRAHSSEEQTRFLAGGAQALVIAKGRYTSYLKHEGDMREIASSCLDLAYMDVVYRAGIYPRQPLGTHDPLDIEDLVALHERLPQPFPGPHKQIDLNPTFGAWSSRVGGADADYIADDTLIDIKTTKHLKLEDEWWLQLVGYALLDELVATDKGRNARINNLAIYYSRYGGYWATPIDPFRKSGQWAEALAWLRKNLTTKTRASRKTS